MRHVQAIIVGTLLVAGVRAPHASPAAQTDSTAVARPDTTAPALPDSVRSVTAVDTLGLPGKLKGEVALPPDPARIKQTLRRMGSSEVEGMTEWERRKNPRVAMLCSALLPGLGQTYNGRRLKVGVMVGFASFYMGNILLNYKRYEASLVRRDAAEPGSSEYRLEDSLAEFYREEARTYVWWSGAVWLIGLLDSWIDAHLYDVRAYTPPAAETSLPRGTHERISYLTVGFELRLAH